MPGALPSIIRQNGKPLLIYSLVALLILWPLLGSGYILTLDMVFTPHLAMPETVTSSYVLHAGLHIANMALASDILQKFMLFSILLLSGFGMHRLMRSLRLPSTARTVAEWAAYGSGLLYAINPFTYSRFMAGQYSVLLGYALLPFFVVSLLRFLEKPSLRQSLPLAAWAVGISIVSIHTLGLAFVVALLALACALWSNHRDTRKLKRYLTSGLAATAIFLVASCYWLLPLLQGNGLTAASITTFQTSDQSAFMTEGNGIAGKLIHVMRLQGFWGEQRGMYLLPQDELPGWGVAVTCIWILVVLGGVFVLRRARLTGMLFGSIVVVAAILATGVGTVWLAKYVPLFAGYREPQKFASLIALGFAVFVGFAITQLLTVIKKRTHRAGLAIILALTLVGFTPVMFRGFDGQLVPRHYPADWYTVNKLLRNDGSDFHVLFLPWHLYSRYQFTGRIIANPGDSFFDKPVFVSDDPEFGGVAPAVPHTQKKLLSTVILPRAPLATTIGHQLKPLGVKYVLLSKSSDYESYAYLDHQTDLQLVTETETLKLYINRAVSEGTTW